MASDSALLEWTLRRLASGAVFLCPATAELELTVRMAFAEAVVARMAGVSDFWTLIQEDPFLGHGRTHTLFADEAAARDFAAGAVIEFDGRMIMFTAAKATEGDWEYHRRLVEGSPDGE